MKKFFLIIVSSILILTAIPFTSAKNFNDLTSYQKQKYWGYIKECSSLLLNKEYSKWKTCALGAIEKASQDKEENAWCNDSDGGKDFSTKGIVKTDIYPEGKEDYVKTFSNGTTYLMESFCSNKNQYAYAQKKCSDFGKKYYAKDGACVYINQPPILTIAVNTTEVNEGDYYEIYLYASDADNDNLTFSAENLPKGAEINGVSPVPFPYDKEVAIFSWTPNYEQAGVYEVVFEVNDEEMEDNIVVKITVKETVAIECNPATAGIKVNSFQTSDGGCIFVGYTGSIPGFDAEGWVKKLGGGLEWSYNFQGGICGEALHNSWWADSIQQTDDGGYIVTAGSFSCGPSGCFLGTWTFKLDKNGSLLWEDNVECSYP